MGLEEYYQGRPLTKYAGPVPQMLAQGIYRLGIPLPGNPLKELNSYIICTGTRPLVIDIGFDRPECYDALTTGLSSLGFAWKDVDLFLTHGHPDHCGCIDRAYTEGMKVYGAFESFAALEDEMWERYRGFSRWLEGRDEYLQCPAALGLEKTAASQLARTNQQKGSDLSVTQGLSREGMDDVAVPRSAVSICKIQSGDKIKLGDYSFVAIRTTGHSPDHICLYEPSHKLLIAGDQILASITPVIASFVLGDNILQRYFDSLDVLQKLEIELVLPGHRQAFTNAPSRIDELRIHHQERAYEILSALKTGPKAIEELCSAITWRNPIPCWADWARKQKYFSIGETLAHLSFLLASGDINCEISDKRVLFISG